MKDNNHLSGEGYEFMESKQDYRTETDTTYRGRGIPMDIEKDGKPKYFNYNIYRYMEKYCQKPKKEKNTRKCYKCDKIEHIAKDYRSG